MVSIPTALNSNFENGCNVAQTIKNMMAKSGEQINSNLLNVKAENSKAAKSANWNFIW